MERHNKPLPMTLDQDAAAKAASCVHSEVDVLTLQDGRFVPAYLCTSIARRAALAALYPGVGQADMVCELLMGRDAVCPLRQPAPNGGRAC